ncbi:MAG: GNAT family N-acetyltransferase [Oscillospiraceae bacterium]|nr:GNAT family N-acetyltransferase [Oscillospiraceae bacterium]
MTAAQTEYSMLMDLLNGVFFQEDKEQAKRDFYTLLPKLYNSEHRPWEHNYVVREDGQLMAAVGMYPLEMNVAGHALRCGGLGNVAVEQSCRGKGYMKRAMDDAMAAMRAQDCDFGELGGLRQRYGYWGFERCGLQWRVELNQANLKHGGDAASEVYEARALTRDDTETLAELRRLTRAAPLYARPNAAPYDVLRSWDARPYAVLCNGKPAAAFVLNRDGRGINDFQLFGNASLWAATRAIFAILPSDIEEISFAVPSWETSLLAQAERLAEAVKLEPSGQYTILRWERVLRALLELQAGCRTLPDGTQTVKINGMFGAETLRLAVGKGNAVVEPFTGTPELELEHLEALRYFLAPYCARPRLPWFPLPLFMYSFDKV